MSTAPSVPYADRIGVRWINALASCAVVGLSCGVYALLPVHQELLANLYGGTWFSFKGHQFLIAGALSYAAVVTAYFLWEKDPGISKSVRFFRMALAFLQSPRACIAAGLGPDDRVAVLSTLLKGFFAPLMAMSLMAFTTSVIGHGWMILSGASGATDPLDLFNRHGYWFLIQAILFVDVLLFTVGYLVEVPALGNRIRSVDPTLLGWAAALLCYPPFNSLSGWILGGQHSDFPQFANSTLHVVFNVMLLVLMAVYASASVALGFKASNLTHRGIVCRGPYRVIRHPAYTCKNMAWWIGAIPLVSDAFAHSTFAGVSSLASVIGWSLLYVLRALTEEDHLRGVDAEYAAYAERVRYRFIPGVI